MLENIDWKKLLTKEAIAFVTVFLGCIAALAVFFYFRDKKSNNKVISDDKPKPVTATTVTVNTAAPSSYHGAPRKQYSVAPRG